MKNLYIVHCVDTEGPLYESFNATFERINSIFGIDVEASEENLEKLQNKAIPLGGLEDAIANLVSEKRIRTNGSWADIEKMLELLNRREFRNQLQDNEGRDWVFNWFCIDHVGFTGLNPRRRDVGDHKIFDFYQKWIESNQTNDIIQWHYHPLPYTGHYNASGTAYLNSNNIWEILCKKIIERNWFPCAFRPGFHTERPDSHWFLEQWIPFDFGNQSVLGVTTDQPDLSGGRYGDWRRAPSDWSIYHPSHDDYQIPGNCKRWIARCLNIEARLRVLTDQDILSAFKRAESGPDTLLAMTNHDFRDMVSETTHVINRIKNFIPQFPNVRVRSINAIEAIRLTLNLPKSRPDLSFEMETLSPVKMKLHVVANGEIFGSQPFLALKTRDGKYIWENFDMEGYNHWSFTFDENHIPPQALTSIGIAANSSYGTTEIGRLDLDEGEWRRYVLND